MEHCEYSYNDSIGMFYDNRLGLQVCGGRGEGTLEISYNDNVGMYYDNHLGLYYDQVCGGGEAIRMGEEGEQRGGERGVNWVHVC